MWYKQGTVTVTQAGYTVTGEGTRWAAQIKAGDVFTVDSERLYEVAAVGGDTALTLATPYAGASGAGLAYSVIQNFTSTMTADLAARVARMLQLYETATGSAVVPAGTVQAFAGVAAPPGWLECNGAAVSRTDYAALYGAVGTTFGAGDGSTTFNLPLFPRRQVAVSDGSQVLTVDAPVDPEATVTEPVQVPVGTIIKIIKV